MKIRGTENNEYILREIGKRIKDVRIAQSMTQREMAVSAGVASKTIERIENGENVKLENILNVLRVLKILQNIDNLIPEQEFLLAEDLTPKRQRVSKKRTEERNATEWRWGDEI